MARLRIIGLVQNLRSVVSGIADFDQALRSQTTVKARDELERIIMFSSASELAGVPIAPPSLQLRLLPYFVPKIYQWRRLAGDEKDLSGDFQGLC